MLGKFITFEGIEGSGKTTQLETTVEYLQHAGKQVVCTREPGGTPLSEEIRSILLNNDLPSMHCDTELMLMFAARIEHIKQLILPALSQGKWVVCDRFYDATYAYQGYGRDISIDRIDQLKQFSIGDLVPDKTLLLDVSLDISMQRVAQRGNKDRFENEKIEFYTKVRKGYLEIAKQNPQRVCVINAQQPIENVQTDIQTYLSSLL